MDDNEYENYLPSLSTNGWLESKETIMTQVFLYFLAGDVYQSNTFKDQVYTLKEVLKESKSDGDLESLLSKYLHSLYRAYFAVVTPNIKVETLEELNEIRYNIDIEAIDDDGKKYKLSRIIQTRDSEILNYQELLNNYKIIKR